MRIVLINILSDKKYSILNSGLGRQLIPIIKHKYASTLHLILSFSNRLTKMSNSKYSSTCISSQGLSAKRWYDIGNSSMLLFRISVIVMVATNYSYHQLCSNNATHVPALYCPAFVPYRNPAQQIFLSQIKFLDHVLDYWSSFLLQWFIDLAPQHIRIFLGPDRTSEKMLI